MTISLEHDASFVHIFENTATTQAEGVITSNLAFVRAQVPSKPLQHLVQLCLACRVVSRLICK